MKGLKSKLFGRRKNDGKPSHPTQSDREPQSVGAAPRISTPVSSESPQNHILQPTAATAMTDTGPPTIHPSISSQSSPSEAQGPVIQSQQSHVSESSSAAATPQPIGGKRDLRTVRNVALYVLDVLSDVSDNIPVPGLKAVFTSTSKIITNCQQISENSKGLDDLAARVKRIQRLIQKSDGSLSDKVLSEDLGNLASVFEELKEDMDKASKQGKLVQFFNGDDAASSLVQHMTELDQAIADFALALDLDTHRRLMQLQVEFRSNGIITSPRFSYDVSKVMLLADRELLESLKPVTDAAFRSYARKSERGCLDGTRTVVLKQIEDWFEKERSPLFWLNGVAGCGKSTIAQTISERFEKRKLLGASFFFARNQAGRSSVEFLFRTIAYQMASAFPLRDKVLKALDDRAVLTSSPDYQFKQLIIEPIYAIRDTLKSPILFVLDGMDECDDEEEEKAVSEIIELFASVLGGTSLPLKIFLTSRPEAHIRSKFFDPDIKTNASRFILHEMQLVDVERDITKYVQSELGKISKLHQSVLRRGPAWPKDTDIADLTTMAAGLFIVASTALKFVGPKPGKGDPRQLLQLILQTPNGASPASSSTKFVNLDRMYSDILKHATSEEQDFEQFRTIIAAIILGFEHLSARALGSLLQLEHRIYVTLEELYSIFLIPEGDALVRPFHASFHDYATDKGRCSDIQFFVDPPVYHARMARLCLVRLQTSLTKRDICNIGNRSLLNREIQDLDAKIKDFLPTDLQYASRHWAAHLAACSLNSSLVDLVRSFALSNILCWMEVLSILGDLGGGLKALRDAVQVVSKSESPPKDLVTMLHDAERFLFQNFDVINVSALHIYYSALPFTPKESTLYRIYEHACRDAPKVLGGIRNTWSACLRTLQHPNNVNAVAISQDGTRIVSGSEDKTVRIWDAKTGETVNELEGHSGAVYAVAISQDGTRIVSGSRDETVRIWDAMTGETVKELKGHPEGVTAIAISQDGTRIVSGSYDHTVRIWDAKTGETVHELKGHSDFVTSVAISQDGTRIVSGSRDKTVRIWDAKTGETVHELKGHSNFVTSVAISQDGTRIVSGSEDWTVRIWDAMTGETVKELKGHPEGVTSVALSQDGTRIVSGSRDETVRIWDAKTGETVNELEGHSGAVYDVALSQDGTRIVSGSLDQTVRIWDAKTGETVNELEGHSGAVYAVAISQDGTRIVSGSRDETVRIWDAMTGETVQELRGHSNYVTAVAVSQDGTRVISGSLDETVRIWDAKTGETVHELVLGHSDLVTAVAISHNGTCIVSRSTSATVMWDMQTGCLVKESGPLSDFTLSESENLPDGQTEYALEDRWIVDMTHGTRVCYVPSSYAISPAQLFSRHVAVLGCDSGEVLILRFDEQN